MAQVRIVLDVGNAEALQKINDVNSQLVELQVNGAQVAIGNPKQIEASKDATAALGKEAQKAGEKATEAASTVQQALQQTEKDARGLKGGLTQAGKQAARAAKDLIHSFINPITIALVAFEAVTKVFTYFWNNLTQNIDKLTARGQSTIKTAQKAIKQTENRTKACKDLISKLEELNKQQALTSIEQKLGQSIVAKLNKEYKNLGITLDKTTGKYKGLYEAQMKLDKINRNAQQRGLRKQLTAQKDIINAELKRALGSGLELGKPIDGSDLFTVAERLGGTFGAQNADLLAQKWGNGTDLKKVREVIQQLMDGLSSRSNLAELQGILDAIDAALEYNQRLNDLRSIDQQIIDANERLRDSFKEQEAAIKSTKDAVKSLQEQYEKTQRENSLAELDPEDRANAIRAEIEQLEKRNKTLQEAQQLNQKQRDKAIADSFSDPVHYDYVADKMKQYEKRVGKEQTALRKLVAKKDDYEKAIKEWDDKISKPTANGSEQPTEIQSEALHNINDVKRQISQAQAQLVSDQKIFEALKQQFAKAEQTYQKSESQIKQLEKGIADIEEQRAQNMLDLQQKTEELAQLERQIEEQRLEAERKLAEEQAKRIKDYNDYVKGLYDKQKSALDEILGQKKQSLYLETKLNAEKKLGRELTDQELESIRNYAQIDQLVNQFKNNTNFKLDTGTVISNDFARKGAYASSVVVDRSVDINQQILQVQKSQKDLLSNIQTLMDKYSVIQ